MTGASDGEDDEDREWRFSLDEVGPDAEGDSGGAAGTTGSEGDTDAITGGADGDATDDDGDDDDGEGALGTFAPSKTIEPESIDLENALFVVLGVFLTVAFFWYLVP